MIIRLKNKPISKKSYHACSDQCSEHRFTLKKIDSNHHHQLSQEIIDISLSFCPQINQYNLSYEE
jgi:hypothetical protein